MSHGDWSSLDPDDYWQSPGEDIQVGDVFVDVPLLSPAPAVIHKTGRRKQRLCLPTGLELGLLFRQFRETWWFLPVTTPDSFLDLETFDRTYEQSLSGIASGWFPLPPLDSESPKLSMPALVCAFRPTLLTPGHPEAPTDRVASLSSTAFEQLSRQFSRLLDEPRSLGSLPSI